MPIVKYAFIFANAWRIIRFGSARLVRTFEFQEVSPGRFYYDMATGDFWFHASDAKAQMHISFVQNRIRMQDLVKVEHPANSNSPRP